MNNEFTHSAKKVLRFAEQEAQRRGHGSVSTAHLLLGLIKLRYGVVAQVFRNLDVDPGKIRERVEKKIQAPTPIRKTPRPLSEGARISLRYAMEEAMDLQQEYIDTEHILLGLMRELRGVGGRVLYDLGLDVKEVREEIIDVLYHAEEEN